jgi:hypothetical protein
MCDDGAIRCSHKRVASRAAARPAARFRLPTSETTNWPPGFSTRNASRNTASLSTDRLITQFRNDHVHRVLGQRNRFDGSLQEPDIRDAGQRRFSRASASMSSVMSKPYTLPVGPTRFHSGTEPCIRGLRETTEHLDNAHPNARIEVLLLLVDEIILDAGAEPVTLARGDQCRRPAVLCSARTGATPSSGFGG